VDSVTGTLALWDYTGEAGILSACLTAPYRRLSSEFFSSGIVQGISRWRTGISAGFPDTDLEWIAALVLVWTVPAKGHVDLRRFGERDGPSGYIRSQLTGRTAQQRSFRPRVASPRRVMERG